MSDVLADFSGYVCRACQLAEGERVAAVTRANYYLGQALLPGWVGDSAVIRHGPARRVHNGTPLRGWDGQQGMATGMFM